MAMSLHWRPARLWQTLSVFGLLFVGLWGCSDEPADRVPGAVEASEPDGPSVTAPISPAGANEVRYPEFERLARVGRIAKLAIDANTGEAAFATCAACHGADGMGSRDGSIPRLAGQHRRVLIGRLVEIDEGVRIRPEMEAYKPALSTDAKIAALAFHIEALPEPLAVRQGSGENLEKGAMLYVDFCSSCHGSAGLGDGANGIPRIGGWDAPSLARTLLALKQEDAEVHETGMSDLVSMLTGEEVATLADYVSRLSPRNP